MRGWHLLIAGVCLGFAGSSLIIAAESLAVLKDWQPLMAATIALAGGLLVYKSNTENQRLQERARRLENRTKYFTDITLIKVAADNIKRHVDLLRGEEFRSPGQTLEYLNNIAGAAHKLEQGLDKASHVLGEDAINLYRHISNIVDNMVEYNNSVGGTPDIVGIRTHLSTTLLIMGKFAREISFLAACALSDLYERRRPRRAQYFAPAEVEEAGWWRVLFDRGAMRWSRWRQERNRKFWD